MKNLKHYLMMGAALAVFVLGTIGASTAPSAANPPASQAVPQAASPVAPDFTQFFRSFAPAVQGLPASDEDLIRNLSPKAVEALGKLSDEERAKALPEIQNMIRRVLSRPDVKRQLSQVPAGLLSDAEHEIWSEMTFLRADVKYNYCHVMIEREAEIAYDEDGVRKLAAAPLACPLAAEANASEEAAAKSLAATLKYVNDTLACTIGDPSYTRVVAPDEAADMRAAVQGTKQAFKGGGLGLNLSMDPSQKLPLSADQMAAWEKEKEAIAKARAEINPCTGKTFGSELTAEELKEEADYKPSKSAFTGVIFHVVKGSPAEKAGFLDGDIITKVDGQVVTGLESDKVIDRMRGAVGTQVTVTVTRGSQEITRTLTRQPVLSDTVWSRDLGDGIYAIVITSFERNNTAFMIYDEVKRLAPKARGFVFDVRNNPGGLLDEAIAAVALFVHDGVIISQRERIEGDPANPQYLRITYSRVGKNVVKETVEEKTGKVVEKGFIALTETDDVTGAVKRQFEEIPFLGDKPAVVLANEHSASAAEIFTGGVSENRLVAGKGKPAVKPQGAIFIGGVHTFGKFIGQAVMPGPMKTAIKATTFRYFSPRNEWLGDAVKVKVGLKSDIAVKMPDNGVPYTATDTQLNFAKAYLLSGGTLPAPVQETVAP